jgi:hypothetical protein
MGERHSRQSMGLDILKPNDTTLWKRALKSKPRRRANDRKLIFGADTRLGILALISNYLKNRVNENHHRG